MDGRAVLETILCFAGAATVMAVIRAVRGGEAPEFMATLQSFRCSPKWSVVTFCRELRAYLAEKLKAGPLERVSGDSNETMTGIDVHAVYDGVEYFVAVKRVFGAQNTQTFADEVRETLMHVPSWGAKNTGFVVVLYGESDDDRGESQVVELGAQVEESMKAWPDIRVHVVGCTTRER